jgi:catechol 2,3-dioxygenase
LLAKRSFFAWLPWFLLGGGALAQGRASYNVPHMVSAAATKSAILPAGTHIGTVTLRVSDAERAIRWYGDMMGMELVDRTPERLSFGAGGKAFLFLDVRPDAPRRIEDTTGLYHIAILVPDRASLGGVLARIAEKGVRLGASDHLVSEALYIWDPDNNGLEIYRDRPRAEWHWKNGRVAMATDPLDRRSVAEEGVKAGAHLRSMPAGTKIGHVHLQVGDLEKAVYFYTEVVGFEQTSGRGSAAFVSAGGYHHHLGMNVWHSLGAGPPEENACGLVEYEIVVPDRAALTAAKARLESAGFKTSGNADSFRFQDPWKITARVLVAPAI